MKAKFFFYYVLPIIIYIGLIFYFSSQSVIYAEIVLRERAGLPIQSWAMHIAEYAILSLLLYRALIKTKFKKYSFVLAVIISIFYGLSDEVHQIFVVGCSFYFYDLVLDGIGGFLMQISIKIKEKIWKNN